MSRSSSVATVDRLVRVLDVFSADRPTWSLADLSAKLCLPKSTLHRFLVSLETHGILRRDPADKLWRLGYRLVTWGELAERATGLGHVARPIMREVAALTGEMVALTVYCEGEVVCLEKIDTNHSVRLALEVGARRPAHAGASSKVLMAYLNPAEVDVIVRRKGLPKLWVNSITERGELLTELSAIRQQGYAMSMEETDPGAWGIATPIQDRQGHVVAAIGVAGPTTRFSEELAQRYVTVCREASQRISALISGAEAAGQHTLSDWN